MTDIFAIGPKEIIIPISIHREWTVVPGEGRHTEEGQASNDGHSSSGPPPNQSNRERGRGGREGPWDDRYTFVSGGTPVFN